MMRARLLRASSRGGIFVSSFHKFAFRSCDPKPNPRAPIIYSKSDSICIFISDYFANSLRNFHGNCYRILQRTRAGGERDDARPLLRLANAINYIVLWIWNIFARENEIKFRKIEICNLILRWIHHESGEEKMMMGAVLAACHEVSVKRCHHRI